MVTGCLEVIALLRNSNFVPSILSRLQNAAEKELRMAAEHVSEHDVQKITELHRALLAQPTTKALAAVDICGVWRTIKPYWPIIVRAAKLIPRIGTLISEILDKLGQGLDLFCGKSA
jgi:hypothetical protein